MAHWFLTLIHLPKWDLSKGLLRHSEWSKILPAFVSLPNPPEFGLRPVFHFWLGTFDMRQLHLYSLASRNSHFECFWRAFNQSAILGLNQFQTEWNTVKAPPNEHKAHFRYIMQHACVFVVFNIFIPVSLLYFVWSTMKGYRWPLNWTGVIELGTEHGLF